MNRARFGLYFLVLWTACQAQPQKEPRTNMHKVTFLTRKGCTNSPIVYKSLLSALAERGISEEPITVDLGELAKGDFRTGYGTPTVLIDDADLFGQSRPAPAPPM